MKMAKPSTNCHNKPTMIPSETFLDIHEGDKLTIKGTSVKDMKLYTDLDHPERASRRIESIGLGENSFTRGFTIPSVAIGDSGWYGCANNDVKVDTSQHDQPDVAWIYVNIKSKKPLMEPEGSQIKLIEGDRLFIKCQCSQQTFFYTNLNHPEKATESIEEETKIAEDLYTRTLEKKSVVPDDSGWYGCAANGIIVDEERFDQLEVKWIYVGVKPKKPSMEPSGPVLNLNEGDELVLECRSYQEMNFYVVLDKPDQGSEGCQEGTAIFEGAYTLALKKKSVVQGDSGWYGCAYSDVKVDTSNHDQPEVNWINVIVKPKA
ncbi:uncharacterized protein LOC130677846 isoform X2 [Microplitis mediator]|uniref:uncharacterized protein LOC130677846 isoform X2 n=1 Tax=Microplitis mediator TaxID=375433 RepID=UPI002552D35E|nr:uncharacterized protein LOC130677846 isoform X2 [Microplitis mediator]